MAQASACSPGPQPCSGPVPALPCCPPELGCGGFCSRRVARGGPWSVFPKGRGCRNGAAKFSTRVSAGMGWPAPCPAGSRWIWSDCCSPLHWVFLSHRAEREPVRTGSGQRCPRPLSHTRGARTAHRGNRAFAACPGPVAACRTHLRAFRMAAMEPSRLCPVLTPGEHHRPGETLCLPAAPSASLGAVLDRRPRSVPTAPGLHGLQLA